MTTTKFKKLIEKAKSLWLFIVFILCLVLATGPVLQIAGLFSDHGEQKKQAKVFKKRSSGVQKELDNANFTIINSKERFYFEPELIHNPIPTNRIWSSVAFSGDVNGLFTHPLAYKTEYGQLSISFPRKKLGANAMVTSISEYPLRLTGEREIDKTWVSGYDDLSTKLMFKDSLNQAIFEGTTIQGSPYFFVKPMQKTLKLNFQNFEIVEMDDGILLKSEGGKFWISTNGKFYIENKVIVFDFSNLENPYLNMGYFQKNSTLQKIKEHVKNTVDSVTSSWNNDKYITTEYDFKYTNGGSTLFGLLPHQYKSLSDNCVYTLETIRGIQCFVEIKDKAGYAISREPIFSNLPWIGDDAEKQVVIDGLKEDFETLDLAPATSYFGAKNLGKLGRMIQIADEINQTDLKNKGLDLMEIELENWFNAVPGENGKFFAYDTELGGLVAYIPEFGSDRYNDHHFHFGYFLYASAVMNQFRPQFMEKYVDVVNQIARDIANTDRENPSFPYARVFDFYEGHSWASGFAKFSDGNNQESSSEAIHAWYSLWMWAKSTNNLELKNFAEYLYNNEINSAETYWLNRPSNESIFPDEYLYQTASIVWGGKYDFKTFFSANLTAIKGIQYLPVTPGSLYLYDLDYIQRDAKILTEHLKVQQGELVDMVLMYLSMDPKLNARYKGVVQTVPLDVGNTRSNYASWVYFWSRAGEIEKSANREFSVIEIKPRNKAETSTFIIECTNATDLHQVITNNPEVLKNPCQKS